jgi:hypothetical protein
MFNILHDTCSSSKPMLRKFPITKTVSQSFCKYKSRSKGRNGLNKKNMGGTLATIITEKTRA